MREQDRGMDGCKVVTSWGQGSGHTQHLVVISGQAHSRLGGLALCPLAESKSILGRMAHPRVLWVRSRGRGASGSSPCVVSERLGRPRKARAFIHWASRLFVVMNSGDLGRVTVNCVQS